MEGEELSRLFGLETDNLAAREIARARKRGITTSQTGQHNPLSTLGGENNVHGRDSVLKTVVGNHVVPYDSSLIPAKRARSGNLSSVNAAAVDTTEFGRIYAREPEPEFEILLSDWRPSKIKARGTASYVNKHFEITRRAIENSVGVGSGTQNPALEIYNPQWTAEVRFLLARRAKVMIHGITNNIDHSDLLIKSRSQLIAFYHGNKKRADNLLGWWAEK